MTKYDIIYSDPPWHWAAHSEKGEDRSAKKHYDVMTLQDIKDLPIAGIANPNSVLLMWAIDPMLDVAFEVMKAWGFKFKTVAFYWVKRNVKSDGYFTGCGYYTRANPEQVLLGTMGKGLPRFDRGVPRLLVTRRREHSQKPDEIYPLVERLFGPDTSRVELFARARVPGWDAMGNFLTGEKIQDTLKR